MQANIPGRQERQDARVFDATALLKRLMGDRGLAERVLAGFLFDAPQTIASLLKALDRSDTGAAILAAHSLKGAAANIGASDLRDTARQMETLGKSGVLDGVRALVPELDARWNDLRAAAEAFCQS